MIDHNFKFQVELPTRTQYDKEHGHSVSFCPVIHWTEGRALSLFIELFTFRVPSLKILI